MNSKTRTRVLCICEHVFYFLRMKKEFVGLTAMREVRENIQYAAADCNVPQKGT